MDLSIPFYLQVAQTIRNRILTGQYAKGDSIPSYQALEKEFQVSNITVRKAIEILVRDKIIERRRGLGMFVSQHDQKMLTFALDGNFQSQRKTSEELPWKVMVLEIGTTSCPPWLRQIFSSTREKTFWCMRRVRQDNDRIISYTRSYWVSISGMKRIKKDEAKKARFTDLLSKKSGIRLLRLDQQIAATVADLDLSAILKVNFGVPLLYVENLYYSDQEKPVAMSQIYSLSDRFSYKTTTKFSYS